MLSEDFFAKLTTYLKRVPETQSEAIRDAARLIVRAMNAGRRTFVFGSGHSNLLTQEVCFRAGGLPIFNPIFVAGLLPTDYPYLRGGLMERVSGIAAAALDTIPVAADDVIVIVSNSGRNHVPIEMAIEARLRRMQIIALTSIDFSSQVSSRHPSGKKLFELSDVVLDNGCPPGDAVVDVPGIPARLGPLSTIVGAAILHALSCEITDLLIEQGVPPPVLMSGNVHGADEYAREILHRYRDLLASELVLPKGNAVETQPTLE
jgi:uncharacterized phosphosugar-binding protein